MLVPGGRQQNVGCSMLMFHSSLTASSKLRADDATSYINLTVGKCTNTMVNQVSSVSVQELVV